MKRKTSVGNGIRQPPQQARLTPVPGPAVSCPPPARAFRPDGHSGTAPVTVVVTASDLLTEEGARACLQASDGVEVAPWDERERAQIAVFLTHEVTPHVLTCVEEISRTPDGDRLPVLLVADDITERQLLDAVDRGVVGLLMRDEVSYTDIVRAVRGALQGDSPMPPAMVRALVDRLRLLKSEDGPEKGSLMPREVDVLRLLADGLSTTEVAGHLNYSERTIKNILHDVITRLKLRNRTQAVAHAIRTGVL